MSVISLITERQKREKPKAKRQPENELYCLTCKNAEFRIWQTGEVWCVGCGSKIRNLLVTLNAPSS